MKNTYLRTKYNINNMILLVFLAVLPLIIAGFYKNGIKLFTMNSVSYYGLFKPLLIDGLGFLIGCLVNIIYEKGHNHNKDTLKEIIYSSFHPLYGLLIASIISINTNIFLFIAVTIIALLISKYMKESKVNTIALTALIIIFIMDILGDFSYLNIYEQSNSFHLVALDYLLGKGSGGINTAYAGLLLISLLILSNKEYYKKEIPLYSGLVYSICIIIYSVITNNIGSILENIFANGILFSFVFIATDPLSSSYTTKGKFIYSTIIGLTTFGLYLIYPPLSALGGIVIASICHKTIDNLCEK